MPVRFVLSSVGGAILACAGLCVSTLALAQTAPVAQRPAVQTQTSLAPNYTDDTNWLCLPGRDDPCSAPLATTALNANGYGSTGQVTPAKSPPADCFYVYPTVSRDRGLNSDLLPGLEERGAATSQFARFGTVCRAFAPVYRSVTLGALPLAFAGTNLQPNFDTAYGDVLAAWREFQSRRAKNRPFVIIGHSQGSIHAMRLISQEIEGKPVAKRMLSAILLGWPVEVPAGKLVGGSFKSTPLCTRTGQTGCVLTYMSFRAESPPAAGSFLGRAARPGMTAGCTNPAALGSDKPAPLDSYWFALAPTQGPQPIAWSSQGPPPTPFLRTEGLATGQCAHDGQAGYLAVRVNADPKDARTDHIPGDVFIAGQINRGWGLHVADMSLGQGDLIRLVEAQSGSYRGARPAR
ncbi:MAG TPA: DUF3089 domain-containing protein [Allosphingosinicella sp.]|jgi:hypothetical protein|uniref:DUF3089 domain-containing protein n=1 Tax=Allosphingosinicella sp. TaxID=2823234 RepID=UPI002F28BFA6